MRLIKLRPWSYCYDGTTIVGFMRVCYDIADDKGVLLFPFRVIKGYDIIVSLNDSQKWHIEQPHGLYERETETPESLMFFVDLLLLENKLLKETNYVVEKPFIFPMNDL